ncbi:MAG: ribulose-phosphate 3-epimerase, ribulose-phosphate 3-epimerase [Parcubacteria group bacterium]|nr:ribulose-phosphate 3-epimerase, ribulose-phosphate 3-epimerase [Parcubacteria group bacterium]
MANIIPAVLADTYDDVEEKLSLCAGHVALVHIDVMDATLTRLATWPYNGLSEEWERVKREEAGFPYWEEFNFEAHLMVKDPAAIAEDWIRAGAERLIVHYESFGNDDACSEALLKLATHFGEGNEHLKIEIGLAVNLSTPVSAILPHVLECDFIQLMAIDEIGSQGQMFQEGAFNKMRELKAVYPETIIAIDGGVNMENAEKLVEAGVERLVVGSAIFKAENPFEALEDLILEVE